MPAPALPASSVSTSATTPSITCSQLSSTSSVRRAGQVLEQPLDQRRVALLAQAEHGRARWRRPRSASFSGARSTNHTPSANALELLSRELQRQARLAAAADAGQRQQPRRRQQAREIGERRLAADEASARLRQVVARALRRHESARGDSA